MSEIFYADANAGLPTTSRHLARVFALLQKVDGNPSSIHQYGRRARVAIEKARRQISDYLQINSEQFLFTSGGTESNNLVLRSFAGNEKPHFLISAGDHPSVVSTAKLLEEQGLCSCSTIPINRHGILQVEALPALVREETCLACLTHANNETGIINDVEAVARVIKSLNSQTHVHCDAVQALGKIEVDYQQSDIDSASFSAHKLGALKGIGGMYVREREILTPQISGGSQELRMRAGTENIAGIISFGIIVSELSQTLKQWQEHVHRLKMVLLSELKKNLPDLYLFAGESPCLPNTVYLHLPYVPVEDLLLNLDLAGIAVSSGSACSSGIHRPSRTLLAMGYDEYVASNAMRVSFSTHKEVQDVVRLVQIVSDVCNEARAKS